MRKNLFYTLLLTCGFAACADHTGTSIVTDGPQAPINEPDTRVIEPNGSSAGSSNANNVTSGGGNGLEGGSGNGGANQGGGAGTGNGGGNGSSAGSSGEGGEGGEGGNGGNPPGGGEGGSPVPEPGTLLLVGTGLAGLAGASLRRRQKKAN